MKIKDIDVNSIKPYEKNAKKHPEAQIEQIANSIREFGFKQPLVIDKNNVLVIGHGRLAAAMSLGIEKVPCILADDLTPEQIKALRLADNKTNESDWDMDFLDIELDDITDIDMSQFGFELFSPDDFGTDFTLEGGAKPEICQMTFTLHEEQRREIELAIATVGECADTFGNTNRNGNALYEVVREWAEQRR